MIVSVRPRSSDVALQELELSTEHDVVFVQEGGVVAAANADERGVGGAIGNANRWRGED